MNTFTGFEFTAYIGIDWADTKHDICIQPAGSDEREFDRIAHRPEDIEQWAYSMHQRFGGPIAVATELSKGPIVSALQKYDFFVHFAVNPSSCVTRNRFSNYALPATHHLNLTLRTTRHPRCAA